MTFLSTFARRFKEIVAKHSCDLCGVFLVMNFITRGLMAALHWGHV